MDTLALREGDFVLLGGSYAFFDGAPKVEQDLKLALGEPLGNDRFHPGWGSVLDTFIGFPLDSTISFMVEQECARVINNYIAVQLDKIQTEVLQVNPSSFTTADVIASITGLDVTPTRNTINVVITIQTADGNTVVLDSTVTQ